METLISIFILILLLFFAPYLCGVIIATRIGFKHNCAAYSLVLGFIFMLGAFQLIVGPLTFFKAPLHVLTALWLTLICMMCITAGFKLKSNTFKPLWEGLKNIRTWGVGAWTVVALVVTQAFISAYFTHYDADDANFVATATTAVYTDTILEVDPYTGGIFDHFPGRRGLSPFPVFCGMIANLSGVHSAIFMHIVLPFVFIILAYIIYALTGEILFKNNNLAVVVFMFFICLLNIWGYTSVYTSSSFLILRIWQGKAVLAAIIIPAILLLSINILQLKDTLLLWVMLGITVLCACAVSSMGIGLSVLCILAIAISDLIIKKDIIRLLKYIAAASPAMIYGLIFVFMMGII